MRRGILIIAGLVAVDQAAKFLMEGNAFMLNAHLGLKYITNSGALFGLMQGWNLLVISISVIALAILLACFFSRRYAKYSLPIALFIAGIIGNLADRIAFGYVRDFIMISVWPVFNLADSYLVTGVCLFALLFFYQEKLFKQGGS